MVRAFNSLYRVYDQGTTAGRRRAIPVCRACRDGRYRGARPSAIQNYVSAEAQLFDKGMVLVVSSAICFVLTFFITIAYRDERDRAVQLAIKNRENEVLLGAALTETGQLRSLLPLCAWCRKIENPDGHWSDLESYLSIQQSTDVTHGMCPDCEKTQGVD